LSAQWTCSNIYSDPTLAKGFCPFIGARCGNISSFNFQNVSESTSVNISLAAGETCTYNIETECGLPSFKPSDTNGFEIENVDYDDNDLQSASRLR
jgi:molybdopterin biosynthesis enzyme